MQTNQSGYSNASLAGGITVAECAPSDAATWDDFVETHRGTYCHLYGWRRVLEQTYGLKTLYLVYRAGDTWAGLLPLAIMPKLPGARRKAISLPYCNYGGVLSRPGIDAETCRAQAVEYLASRGVNVVEFRDIAPERTTAGEVSMLLRLPATAEQLWTALGAKVRNQVRKAQRANLTAVWGRGQAAILYDIYAVKMGELGTPVHSRRFVSEILEAFGDRTEILTVRHDDQPVAAMLLIRSIDTWVDPLAASLSQFNALNPNMLMYWEALKTACDAGAAVFDFGRSHRGSGTYRFKEQWGAQETALDYTTFCGGKRSGNAATDFYRGAAAGRLSRTWKKLPAPLQMWLGPVVRRWVP